LGGGGEREEMVSIPLGVSLKSVAAVYRHDDTKKSAWRILNYLLSLQGGMVLEIQREMIDQRKTLDQTFIGQQLLKDLLERKRELEGKMELEDRLLELRNDGEGSYLTGSLAKLDKQRKSIYGIDFQHLRMESDTRYREEIERLLKLRKSPLGGIGQQLLQTENEMQDSVESSGLNKTGSEGGESEERKYTQYTPVLSMGMTTSKTGSSLPELTPPSIGLGSSQVADLAGVADLRLGLAKAREGSERSRVPLSIANNSPGSDPVLMVRLPTKGSTFPLAPATHMKADRPLVGFPTRTPANRIQNHASPLNFCRGEEARRL
jgi:hypothetical protein